MNLGIAISFDFFSFSTFVGQLVTIRDGFFVHFYGCFVRFLNDVIWNGLVKNLFIKCDLDLSLKIRILRCDVFLILLYGYECWNLNPCYKNVLKLSEFISYRKILRISWIDRSRNIEILKTIHEKEEADVDD